MANITGDVVPRIQTSELAVTCQYNNYGKYAAQNQAAIAPYLSIPGLPSLNGPVAVQNAMDSSGNRLGNGSVVIMPPGVCFSFQIGYLCSLGFSYNITLLPVNIVMRDNWYYWFVPPQAPRFNWATVSQWKDGSVITVDDAQFANTGTLTPAQANYVNKSFQIRIEVWPMTKLVTNDNKTYTPVMAAPGAPPPAPGAGINTHPGTVGKGDKHSLGGATTKELRADTSRKTAIVFDVLVMNQKYYQTGNVSLNY